MSEQIDWSKAPADATHYQPATHGVFECWLKPGHAVRVSRGEPDWREDDYADDLIATSAIKRPWSGEGLPPVGVDIEVLHELYGWIGARVVGQDGEAAIVRTNDGYAGVFPHQMRPIRTPEQIAADEREAAIDEMLAGTPWPGSDISLRVCEKLYDAGYRKP